MSQSQVVNTAPMRSNGMKAITVAVKESQGDDDYVILCELEFQAEI